MKIIRTLEDFHNLENSNGLTLRYDDYYGDDSVRVYLGDKQVYTFCGYKNINTNNAVLIAMGFKFEWKPKRTLEEVLNDYKEINFVIGQDNCAIYEDVRNGGFSVGIYRSYKTVGTKYYLKKDAEKICEELNDKW
ncbi:MAG: hypothetical protein ACRC6V_09225 [Bacteroidales bacterium]